MIGPHAEMRQHTIREELAFEGIGLHTGADVRARLVPQAANTGIVFSVAGGSVRFPARPEYVVETRRATVVGKDGHTISTVEHLLSAVFAMGIDNVLIDVDGPEIPVADGSGGTFAAAIAATGLTEQDAARLVFSIDRPVYLRDGEAMIVVVPADEWRIRFTVDYPTPVGAHYFDAAIGAKVFLEEIAPGRTFGYLHEVEGLLKSGLARGGTLDNALVFAPEGPMTPLRWPNEVVRHKVLDLIGDFSLLGAWPACEVVAIKSGHKLHAQAVREMSR